MKPWGWGRPHHQRRNAVLSQIGCAFGHNSIIGRGNNEGTGFATIETSEPEAALFALAEQVDLAEKAFHNALVCRNEAQIAYLRDPSIMTLQALEKSKTAEAVALDILDTEIRRLASTRATTVIGLKLKASYASTGDKLADSIVGTSCDFKPCDGRRDSTIPAALTTAAGPKRS